MIRGALAAIVAGLLLGSAEPVRADDAVQPLISPDDGDTDGFLARYVPRVSLGGTYVSAPGASAEVYSLQTFLGPVANTPLENYSLRLKWTAADGTDSDLRGGPFTFALQRYLPIDPLVALPLLAIHFGIDGAISTPWLSNREAAPPAALTALGIDTELANNGWSFRPSAYARLDFLGCRDLYVEAGAGPEVFAPTKGSDLVAIRYRVALGFDVGCDSKDLSQIYRPGIVLEYRGRGIAYDGPADPSYDDLLTLGLQWVVGRVTVSVTGGAAPSYSFDRYELALHLQTGFWRNR